MRITITLDFDSTYTPAAARLTEDDIREAIEAAMVDSDFLNRIAKNCGDNSRHNTPAWDFGR